MCFFSGGFCCCCCCWWFYLTCKLWEPPSRNWPARKSSALAFSRKAFATVDHSGCLMSARLTLKEDMIRDRVIRHLHPINWIGTSYGRAKCLKYRSLLCIDLRACFEDLQTSQKRSCTVITDGSVLPSTFYISGETCPLLTVSRSQRLSCSSRGCCGVLVGSPALNEDVVTGKWLLTLSLQVLGSNTIFWLILHYIVIEVILQKKRHIYCWTNNALLWLVCQHLKE